MEIIIDVIHGNKFTNEFMKHSDVFESGKWFGNHETIELEGEPDLFRLAENIKLAFEEIGSVVTFVGLKLIDGQPISNGVHYFKSGVQSISNGRQWGLFCEMLECLGYIVETDEIRRVTNVMSYH